MLAGRAIECRAAALYDARHGAPTVFSRTGMSFPVIDAEAVLKVTQRAVSLDVIAQGRATRDDCFRDDLADGLRQHFADIWIVRYGACRAGRVEAGAPQRLANIDVAEACDQSLVEQRGFKRRAP